MMIAIVSDRKLQSMLRFLTVVILCAGVGVQIGFAKGEDMKKEDFQMSIDGQPVQFTPAPIFREGTWFVPLKPFAEQLGLKIEYPQGTEMVVLCGGVESELCVPLEFQNGDDAVDVNGVTYVQPAHISKTFGFEVYKAAPNQLAVIHPTHLAPEFTLPDLAGTPKHLQDFRGKKTFLYVWGSW